MRYTYSRVTGRIIERPDCKIEFNKIELAWAAGFFDGEGCTTSYIQRKNSNKEYWTIRLSIPQVDKRPLERFIKAIKRGKIYKSNESQIIHRVQFGTLEDVQYCISILWNYLSEPKKEQYKKVIKDYLNGSKEMNKKRLIKNPNQLKGFALMWERRNDNESSGIS